MTMRTRRFALTPMRPAVFWGLVAAVLAVCLAVGLGMRASLTDYSASPDAVDGLDYQITCSTEGLLSLYSEDEVLDELGATGYEPPEEELDAAHGFGLLATDNIESNAPLVVVGSFNGNRTYVNRAFLCEIEVSRVIKGDDAGVLVGETIKVYDPFWIREKGPSLTEGGWFSSERVVQLTGDSLSGGMTPMRDGQEYLLFLEPKEYPEAWKEDPSFEQTYLLVNHPYARISTQMMPGTERACVIDAAGLEQIPLDEARATMTVMPEVTVDEASAYDMCVWDEDVARLYGDTCERILSRVLG